MTQFAKRLSIVILSISSLIFISLSQAKSLHQDPCDNISGHWTGTWISEPFMTAPCKWHADVVVESDHKTIRLNVKLSNPNHRYCRRSEGIDLGICENGQIKLTTTKLQGTIFGNEIMLESGYMDGTTVSLTKI